MGQLQFGRRRQPRVEWDRPCSLAPRYRYRVVLTAKDDEDAGVDLAGLFPAIRQPGLGPQVAWATNDGAYARWLAATLNWLVGKERAGVEIWNRADDPAQSRWIRLRPGAARG
jgi:hypothetical protein